MGKVCAVDGCNSGSAEDIRQRTADGVRKCSTFGIPARVLRDALLLKIWQDELQIEKLTKNHRICELHFAYEDLNISDDYHKINDEVIVSVREKITLKDKARPKRSVVESYQHRKDQDAEYCLNRKKEYYVNMKQPINFLEVIKASQYPTAMEISDDVEMEQVSAFDSFVTTVPVFGIANLLKTLNQSQLRQNWSWRMKDEDLVFSFVDHKSLTVRCHLQVFASMKVTILLADKEILCNFTGITQIKSFENLTTILEKLENQNLCMGLSLKSRSASCAYYTAKDCDSCPFCTKEKAKLENKTLSYESKYKKLHEKHRALVKKCDYMSVQLDEARKKITALELELRTMKTNYWKKVMDELPKIQREIINTFITFGQLGKNKNLYRCSRDWICECFVMHTKSSSLYEYMREKGILPLACPKTLKAHTGAIGNSYGFHDPVFKSLQLRCSTLKPMERRGILLSDETSINEAVGLDSNWVVQGYTDYGSFTPDNLKNVQANHALCLVFRPFVGSWVQPIGAFAASKTTGDILDDVLKQALEYVENAGFFVDAIGMDGANVNRNIWMQHNVNENNVSCRHPLDHKRRLWFISDPSHLWKNLRNLIMKLLEFWTPDGLVKKAHWQTLLEIEAYTKFNLKIAYFLRPDHLDPKGYQTMNVLMAMQIFSPRAMEVYKDKHKSLEDSKPTIAFIKKVRALIDAMRSLTPGDALRMDENCSRRKAITGFIEYLQEWKDKAKEKKWKFPLTGNTYKGFIVTLKATLELLDYLHEDHGYDYLMTDCVSSDPIERVFGIIKAAAGCNDTPNAILFPCLFKIFCTYGLLKTVKNSNIERGEVLQVLATTKESTANQLSNKNHLKELISNWICQRQSSTTISNNTDHIYTVVNTDTVVISDVSGWVVCEMMKKTECKTCHAQMKSFSETEERHKLTNLRERFGGLIRSSQKVFELIQVLENAFTYVLATSQGMYKEVMDQIVKKIIQENVLTLIGCESHEQSLTHLFIIYYLERRAKMACNRQNIVRNAAIQKQKQLRKQAKLVT